MAVLQPCQLPGHLASYVWTTPWSVVGARTRRRKVQAKAAIGLAAVHATGAAPWNAAEDAAGKIGSRALVHATALAGKALLSWSCCVETPVSVVC